MLFGNVLRRRFILFFYQEEKIIFVYCTTMQEIVRQIDDAYKAFRAEKKAPTTKTASTKAQAAAIHGDIVDELAKVRGNIELFRAMLRRVTVPPTWRKEAERALRKMETLKDEWSRAEKRWRPHPIGTKSIYPGSTRSNTGVRLNSAVIRLFKQLQTRYETKTRNVAASIKVNNTPVKANTKNLGTSPATMFGYVQKAWDAYTARRRRATVNASRTNAARTIEKELGTLKLNLVLFKAVRDRARASTGSKTLATYVKRVIDMYSTYIKQYEDAYAKAKRGQNPPLSLMSSDAFEFSKQAVRFIHFASASLGGAALPFKTQKRRRTLSPGEVLNQYGISAATVINMENQLNQLQQRALAMQQNVMNKNLNLQKARRQLQTRQQTIDDLSAQLMTVHDAWQECERQKRTLQAFNSK
jgi:hypothetical protein